MCKNISKIMCENISKKNIFGRNFCLNKNTWRHKKLPKFKKQNKQIINFFGNAGRVPTSPPEE